MALGSQFTAWWHRLIAWWHRQHIAVQFCIAALAGAFVVVLISLAVGKAVLGIGQWQFQEGYPRHLEARVRALTDSKTESSFIEPRMAEPGLVRGKDGKTICSPDRISLRKEPKRLLPMKVQAMNGFLLVPEPSQKGGAQTIRHIAGVVLPPDVHVSRERVNDVIAHLVDHRGVGCVLMDPDRIDCQLVTQGASQERLWLSDQLLTSGLVFPGDCAARSAASLAASARRGIWWDGLRPDIPAQQQIAWRMLADATVENVESAAVAANTLKTGHLTTALSSMFLAATAMLVLLKGVADDRGKRLAEVAEVAANMRLIDAYIKDGDQPESLRQKLLAIIQADGFKQKTLTAMPDFNWSDLERNISNISGQGSIIKGSPTGTVNVRRDIVPYAQIIALARGFNADASQKFYRLGGK